MQKKGPQHRLKSLDRLIWLVDCGNEALWSNMSKVYRSRSRTSIRIFPHFGVHIYWSAAAWFISSVETWGSLQFSGYWKRSMAIKIGYPPIIETTPIFTDMFLSNYNIIYIYIPRFPANDSNNAYTSYSTLYVYIYTCQNPIKTQ